MIVTHHDLRASLDRIRARVDEPHAGLFGPGSRLWEINREAVVFLGGGRAALLQVAHPLVAQAIADHSRTREDLAGRFRRTFENVFAMVFGDLETALTSARRVHAIHSRIQGKLREEIGPFARGTAYAANDEETLLWVHATLWETSITVYERLVRPLSTADKERYYAETRRFAHLFGISDAALPGDWNGFVAYNRRMWRDVLAVGSAAAEIARYLFVPARRTLTPLARWYRLISAGLLPEPVREAYGFRFGRRERVTFGSSLKVLGAAYPGVPRRFRYLPAYVRARRRLAGREDPDVVGTALERTVARLLRPSRFSRVAR